MSQRNFILIYLNGERRQISGREALGTLLSYIRNTERLTGSKLGCGEGGCGACTVMQSVYEQGTNRIHHRAVNACLMPVAACDGTSITTIEAVGDRNGNLHPIQMALVNSHGTQCGFCTPGIVMSMYAMIREHVANPDRKGVKLTHEDVETAFDGNLCRCTGYRPILDAFKNFVDSENTSNGPCSLGENCCKQKKTPCEHNDDELRGQCLDARESHHNDLFEEASAEFVFPPELIEYQPFELNICENEWLRPVSMQRLVSLKCQHPEARIIVGNTEIGIDVKFKNLKIATYICTSHITELSQISESEDGVRIGASVTWSELLSYIQSAVRSQGAKNNEQNHSYRFNSLLAIQSQLRWFAGKQIRNVAAVGGNIVTASPISDINPIWVAADARFVLLNCKTRSKRHVLARHFFLGYRKVDMQSYEVLLHVELPWNKSPFDFVHAFKVSRRQEDDIALVCAAVRFVLTEDEEVTCGRNVQCVENGTCSGYKIDSASISLGGLAPMTIAMEEVELALNGKKFSEETLSCALRVMARCTALAKNVPGGMPEYRQCLAVGFLFKAFMITSAAINQRKSSDSRGDVAQVSSSLMGLADMSQFRPKDFHLSKGIQISPIEGPPGQRNQTGKSIQHLSAQVQVTGEAKYVDDIPPFARELQAALVLSTEAHAEILSVDYATAEKMPGVYRIIKHKDVRGANMIGNANDEYCFADSLVTTMGQVIAIVVAATLQQAKDAAAAVKVQYNVLKPIVTIEEAIAAGSFAPGEPEHTVRRGNASEVLRDAETRGQTVEGCVRIGAQEHWYLEPQGTVAVPEESGEMTIFASTQTPSKTQATVARVLGEPMNKIVCKVKRIGGGFGGKETRSFFISAAAAVAAQVTLRPVRLILDRDTDMLTTGTRHAFLAQYKAAYEPNGRITALDLQVFLNMGNSFDLSIPVLDRCLYHAQNCYDIENVNFVGKACLTHSASSTAFRGFGGPQGMMIGENVIEHVAHAVKQSAVLVRSRNMYGKNGNGSTTPFGMGFDANPLLRCWDEVLQDSSYAERREEVNKFNATYKYRKRGLAVVPTMFGISFTFKTFNQAAALVHIFHQDGTVLISHGGVEMGQGLHTKMIQVAATEFGIPLEKLFIAETSTDKVPNASPTAASASSDMYGMAVQNACRQLLKNLEPFRKRAEDQSWEELIHQGWFNRVNLSATGFYKTPNLDQVNLAVPGSRGKPFFYYTNGAAVSEVEVDTLTGESNVRRTDIVMDVGRPLNPAVDIGQIEGAFVQGLGWCTMEEVVRGSSTSHTWLKPGKTHTLGPGTYKIPGFQDIPADFRVRLLNERNEENTIHSSKGVGEPPLFLAASVFFAIRDAASASRHQNECQEWFELDSPASAERVRLLCINKEIHAIVPTERCRASLSL